MRSLLAAASLLAIFGAGALAQPMVVCTTTIISDVVSLIAGEAVDVRTLLPIGADPHSFEATPQDLVLLSEATAIFSNGAELEAGLEPILESVDVPLIALTDGLDLLPAEEEDHETEQNAEVNDEHDEHGEYDPHVWLDPTYVAAWTHTIERELNALAPTLAEEISARAEAYRESLSHLDAWVMSTVADVPADRRSLVTDHLVFAYFAARYGFTQAGAVLPSATTAADPSARELAELMDGIRELNVSVIFTGETVASSLVEQVAQDTGTNLVYLFIGSLSAPSGPAGSYVDLIRYDVQAMVDALLDSP